MIDERALSAWLGDGLCVMDRGNPRMRCDSALRTWVWHVDACSTMHVRRCEYSCMEV